MPASFSLLAGAGCQTTKTRKTQTETTLMRSLRLQLKLVPTFCRHSTTSTLWSPDVNEKPEFLGTPSTSITQDENELASETLADYDARDEEGSVTWSLTGDDRGDFSIDSDGALTFNSDPNFEDAKDSDTDNIYKVTVVATDVMSGTTRRNVTQDVTVTVNDLEEDGTVSVNNLNPGVGDELSFELSDPDGLVISATSTITWDLEQRASSSAVWQDVSGFGGLNTTSTLATWRVGEDETGKQLRMQVSYTDNRGAKTVESEVTAAVTADPIVNAPPRFRGGGDFSIAEGEAGRNVGTPFVVSDRDNDSLRFGIEAGAGDDLFAINATSGQLEPAQGGGFRGPAGVGLLPGHRHTARRQGRRRQHRGRSGD